MKRGVYVVGRQRRRRVWPWMLWGAGFVLLVAGAAALYVFMRPYGGNVAVPKQLLQFDASVATSEKQEIVSVVNKYHATYSGDVQVHATTSLEANSSEPILDVYVPVANVYSPRLQISKAELAQMQVRMPAGTPEVVRTAIAKTLGLSEVSELAAPVDELTTNEIAFVPIGDLSPKVRLLALDGSYYLDDFTKGAVFRQAVFSGDGQLSGLKLADLPDKNTVLKVNMTGTTALTRKYILRINGGYSPDYFSANIGKFLADADITHVSNEVSFDSHCVLKPMTFCAPPSTIETLKSSGVDLVELTGNHNNDFGSADNAATIQQYHALGWHTVGGGLNSTEAAKPYVADMKGSKVAFLAYNDADGPNSGVIAGPDHAGGNAFSWDKVTADIAAAKQQGAFVIVDLQYHECYAYPAFHTPYPICYQPIPGQVADFRKIADLGANMVIGTQAHQPQTYEVYKGVPIYYGLGNLYFDQVEWPDTEQGYILTHYFAPGGKLLQTKLIPTVYDEKLQVRPMTGTEATAFLNSLNTARSQAGL